MENKCWSDIQAQGENLPHVIRHLYTTERDRLETAAKFLRNDRPIIFIGVASAEYLCMPAAVYLGQHGRVSSTMCASDGLYSYLPALCNANVVINSRSGETAEVVKLAQALVEAKTPFVLITNEPDSTVAQMATHVVWANTRKDELVSINVVTGMMTVTMALAAAVVGELDALRPGFEALGQAMAETVRQATEQKEEIFALFEGIRPVYLLYRGYGRGAACCGRLVLEEVSRSPSIAMEAAEFRQGPNEVVDENFGAVLFVPEGKQGDLNRSLAADMAHSGGRVLLVGDDGVAGERVLSFPIPAVPDCLSPVLQVVPVQMLAYQRAKARGYEPGEVRYITKIILTEEGIPNQI